MMRTDPETKAVGITGGVGAGKSRVLRLLEKHACCRVIIADELAKKLQLPGERCYEAVTALLGTQILQKDGTICRPAMASLIYGDEELRRQVNEIIHPAVTEEIRSAVCREKNEGKLRFLFIEAALLIENGFDRICDELWYVYAPEEVRRQRLRTDRGYSDEKISAIMASQLSEAEFRRACGVVIDNSGSVEETEKQIIDIIKKRGGA